MTNIDVQEDEGVLILTDENEATLTEDEIRNPFKDTSSEEELDDK